MSIILWHHYTHTSRFALYVVTTSQCSPQITHYGLIVDWNQRGNTNKLLIKSNNILFCLIMATFVTDGRDGCCANKRLEQSHPNDLIDIVSAQLQWTYCQRWWTTRWTTRIDCPCVGNNGSRNGENGEMQEKGGVTRIWCAGNLW